MQDLYGDRHINDSEQLEHLESLENEAQKAAPRRRADSGEELPGPVYRLKMLHSNETFYGYYVPSGDIWPRFRNESELDILLEGPLSASAEDAAAPLSPGLELGPEPESGPQPGVEESTAAADAVPALSPIEARQEDASEPSGSPLPRHIIPTRALAVAPTKYGKDIVEIQGLVADTNYINPDELVVIERPAGIDDLRKLKNNKDKEKQAYELCRDKIWARNLPMKLVSAHYLLDEPKILFYFTAEARVDFRELVKDLVALFKTRIELRQIGVRDEARVIGGSGVCGRVLCCHGVSDRLNPVSIKMAKDQNLSLNSLKISGPCGRLLCCLSYEHQFYKDARRELPQEGSKFIYDGALFKVVEVNVLLGTVRMAGEDGRMLDMKAERFRYSEGRWKVIEEVEERA